MKFLGHDIPKLSHILKRVDFYADTVAKEQGISKIFLYLDYFGSFVVTGCGAMDYFLYRFYKLNWRGKLSFMTVRQRVAFDHKHNNNDAVETVLNKEKALKHFSKWVNRDWCGQELNNTKECYRAFELSHKKAIVKPLRALGGSGVEIIELSSLGGENDRLFNYCKENNLLAEELITQDSEVSRLYPHAVNTVRIVTCKGICIGAAIRIGVGGHNVDNAHAGGIYAELDKETGVIVSKAMDYSSKSYVYHPDTGTTIPGFKVPFWNECIQLAKEASKVIEGVALVGWDLAITPNGPTIVEVNHMPSLELIQSPNRKGLRREIIKAIRNQ